VAGAYSLPYQRARQVVGDRGDGEIDRFSGSFDSYVLSPATNRLWGWTQAAGESERWLFPGLMGSALAVSAVTTPAAPWVAAVAVTGLVAADASRGSAGLVYPIFRRLLSPYRGLRVPARFGMLTLTMLALLAAFGCGTMGRAFGGRPRAAVLAALVLLLMGVETLANVPVRRLPRAAPPVYAFLGALPPTVIAHAPLPRLGIRPSTCDSSGAQTICGALAPSRGCTRPASSSCSYTSATSPIRPCTPTRSTCSNSGRTSNPSARLPTSRAAGKCASTGCAASSGGTLTSSGGSGRRARGHHPGGG
jgi:hypothetical protein